MHMHRTIAGTGYCGPVHAEDAQHDMDQRERGPVEAYGSILLTAVAPVYLRGVIGLTLPQSLLTHLPWASMVICSGLPFISRLTFIFML